MTKIFAHRGASGDYPENTMLAFRKAAEAGAEGIELDVQLTKDGEIVIIHDEKVDRVGNASGYVRDFTLEEIKKIDVSYNFTEKYGFQSIPTLREYFDFVKENDIITNIEIKNSVYFYKDIEEKVIALIKEYKLSDRIIFSSFNHYSMVKCKELCPEIETGLLYSNIIYNPGEYGKTCGCNYMHPQFNSVNDITLSDMRRNGLGCNTWTVNENEDIERLIKADVNSIITNYPERAVKLRKKLLNK